MANTYTQIYIQVVFAVSGRACLITSGFKEELYKYITGIVRNRKQKLIAVNGMPDHLHMLIGMRPDMALSELVGKVKASSSNFINDHRQRERRSQHRISVRWDQRQRHQQSLSLTQAASHLAQLGLALQGQAG